MAKKTRGKNRKQNNAAVDPRIEKLLLLQEWFKQKASEYEAHLNSECVFICEKIQKVYMDHLKAIPEDVRRMTVEELMKLEQEKAAAVESSLENNLEQQRIQFEKTKLMSEKKKSRRIDRAERKRSQSVVSNSTVKSAVSIDYGPKITRILSESSLNTPISKKSVVKCEYVTPKFNPKVPVSKALLRQPRCGEVLMSLSGSPLQNPIDAIATKPGVTVSLGGGKVINITADSEVEKLQNNFMNEIDDYTRMTLEDAKQKLARILKS